MMVMMVMTAVAPRRWGDLLLVVVFGSGLCCETHDDCWVRYVPCDNNDADQFSISSEEVCSKQGWGVYKMPMQMRCAAAS